MTDDDLAIDMASTVSLSPNAQMRKTDYCFRAASAASARGTGQPRIFLSGRYLLFGNPRPAQSSVLLLSKTINQAPFSTYNYRCTPSWLDTVGYGIPKGWAHTRNLLLRDTTQALLKHHLGVMVHRKLIDQPTATNAFPKLELVAVTDAQGFTRLRIYKPMSLASIMERLDIDTYTQRSFYGTIWNRKEPTAFPTGFARSRLAKEEIIVALDFQNGAYLLPDNDSDETGVGYCTTQKLPQFRFEAHGSLPEDRELAISGIAQFLKCYRREQQYRPEAEEPVLALAIPTKLFHLFSNAFHQTKLMPYRLSIKLTTQCHFKFFRDSFAHLAGMYAVNWSPRPIDPKRKLFVVLNCVGGIVFAFPGGTVTAAADTANAAAHGPADANENQRKVVQYGARLDLGHWDEADANGNALWSDRGFTGSLALVTHMKGEASQTISSFRQVYPCNEAYETV